jgi:hypothetical protein
VLPRQFVHLYVGIYIYVDTYVFYVYNASKFLILIHLAGIENRFHCVFSLTETTIHTIFDTKVHFVAVG